MARKPNGKPAQAPYHFVPLSAWVHMPKWSAYASHDMPFKDGISGTLDVTITNTSPLLIGDGLDPKEVSPYLDINGQPTIPGSSIKGMLRNFLEIATFAKLSRMDGPKITKRISTFNGYNVETGWLKHSDGEWKFYPCNSSKIANQWIKETVPAFKNVNFKADNFDFNVLDKYKLLGLENQFSFKSRDSINNKDKSPHVEISNELNKKQGHIIFGGSVDVAQSAFVFYEPEQSPKPMAKLQQLVSDLFEAHSETYDPVTLKVAGGKEAKVSSLNEYYQKLDIGIPVFLATNDKTREQSLGYCKSHRKIAKTSVEQARDNVSKFHGDDLVYDFPETLFGTVRRNNDLPSLKSRVMFTDATCEQEQKSSQNSGPIVQGEPKPSFEAAYLSPNGAQKYDDNNAQIRGWKRYPIQASTPINLQQKKPQSDGEENENVTTLLKPIAPDSKFAGKIHFHNLKPAELGALVWALELHERDNGYHSLGRAKAYGYGKIKLNIVSNQLTPNLRSNTPSGIETYQQDFIDYMSAQYSAVFGNEDWKTSPQITSLISMSQSNAEQDQNLKYMSLKEHQKAEPMPSFDDINEREPKLQNQKTLNPFEEDISRKLVVELQVQAREEEEALARLPVYEQFYEKLNNANEQEINPLIVNSWPSIIDEWSDSDKKALYERLQSCSDFKKDWVEKSKKKMKERKKMLRQLIGE